jgi:Kae1-associated kinase Bud32
MKLAQGAEAVISKEGDTIVKDRIAKSYRHPELDARLRSLRTKKEAKLLKSLPVLGPKMLDTDDKERIVMSFVDGVPLRDCLDGKPALARDVGVGLRKLHDKHIIHGDLTTSNMILSGKEIAFIDFGLSFHSRRIEDKAVDIHLFKQALASSHWRVEKEAFEMFWKGYGKDDSVRERFAVVESRGRNKEKY